jgi:hypothetical protein
VAALVALVAALVALVAALVALVAALVALVAALVALVAALVALVAALVALVAALVALVAALVALVAALVALVADRTCCGLIAPQEVAKVLLEGGANPLRQDNFNGSALLEALKRGDRPLIDLLLGNRARSAPPPLLPVAASPDRACASRTSPNVCCPYAISCSCTCHAVSCVQQHPPITRWLVLHRR